MVYDWITGINKKDVFHFIPFNYSSRFMKRYLVFVLLFSFFNFFEVFFFIFIFFLRSTKRIFRALCCLKSIRR